MQCTCGAQLPDDARFCLRCGKPQFDLLPVEPVEESAPSPSAAPSASSLVRIDFGNRRAISVSITVALMTLFIFTTGSTLVPGPLLILPLFCFSGFAAARWYIRKTGDAITPQGGARLGFMTALWSFLIVTVFSVAFAVLLSSPSLRQQLVEMLANNQNEAAKELSRLLDDPRRSILFIMGGLLVNFCLFTFPSMLGGMLAVRTEKK